MKREVEAFALTLIKTIVIGEAFKTDKAIVELFPDNVALRRWIELAGEQVAWQGLPARICWLGYGERQMWRKPRQPA